MRASLRSGRDFNGRRVGLGLLLAVCAAGGVPAAEVVGASSSEYRSGNVDVRYASAETLTEPALNPRDRERWLADLSRYIGSRAEKLLPAGERLIVTLTDVQLAGRVEAWRGPAWSDVRIVRDVTPPRIELSFRLESADGGLLKAGERRLRDIDFLGHPAFRRSDSLPFEKKLIDDWLARDFGRALTVP